MRKNLLENDEGVMALEACISLTLFLIVMLALYSMIHLFTAQSMISHSLQQTGQSIALENYKNTKMDVKTLQKIPLKLLGKITGGWSTKSNDTLDTAGGTFSDETKVSKKNVKDIAEKRFESYFGGNNQHTDSMLRSMGVVDGLKGINFDKTTISGDDIVIEISYKVRLIFYIEMFHFGEFESTQKVCCRLWK